MSLFTFSLNTARSHLIITTPTDVYALPYLGLSFGTPQGPSGDEQVTFFSNGLAMVSVRIMQSNLTGATWQLRIADLIANYLYMPVGSSAGSVTSIDVSGGTTGLTTTGGPVTTSGTITIAGTVNATHGGTGQTTYAAGDLLYASAANTLSKLAAGANTNVLTLAAGVPSWAAPATSGTVTSVDVSGGTTGLTFTGGPVTGTGTITMAGTLDADNGGTGQTVYAVGDILAANTTTTLSKVADVATGNALISGGVGVLPSYGKIGLTTHVSGTLGPTNGGTGQSTYATGDILYASAANTLSKLAAGTNTHVLTLAAGVPSWAAPAAGGVTTMGANVNPTANSASITGTTLNMAAGGASTRGVMYGWTDTDSVTFNTFVGYNTPNYTTSGLYCAAVGAHTLRSLTNGQANFGCGIAALSAVTSGTRNIGVGNNAGNVTTTGSDNICVGADCINSANNTTHEYVFGSGRGATPITGNGSDTYTFDISAVPVDTSTALVYINTTTGKLSRAASSMRHKDPLPDPPLAQFFKCLDQLKPRAFTFKNDPLKKPAVGYYAEEVEAIRGPLGKPVFGALLNYTEVDDTDQPMYPSMVMRVPEGEREPRLVEEMVYPKKQIVEGINYQGFVLPLIAYCKWNDARLSAIEQHLGLTPPAPVN